MLRGDKINNTVGGATRSAVDRLIGEGVTEMLQLEREVNKVRLKNNPNTDLTVEEQQLLSCR